MRSNGRIKLSTALEDTRGILYCLLRLRGDEEPPLSQRCSSAPAHKHRCSAVCVFQCSSRHSWLQLFVLHPLSSSAAHTHTHNLSAFKTNMQLHKDAYVHTPLHIPPKHKNIMLMRHTQMFLQSSLSLSYFNSSLIIFLSFKEPPSRNGSCKISLREIRSIFMEPYDTPPKSDV